VKKQWIIILTILLYPFPMSPASSASTTTLHAPSQDIDQGLNPPPESDMQVLDTASNKPSVSYIATATKDNIDPSEKISLAAVATKAVPLVIPPADTSVSHPTPEQCAAALAEGKKAKAAAIAAAHKEEDEKTAAQNAANELFEFSLTGLKDAGVDITKAGFGITGKFDLGITYIRSTFAVNTDGLFAQTYIPRVKLGNLLEITGVGPDGKYGTPDDGVLFEARINKHLQRITLSGLVNILGAMAETEMIVGSEKFSYMSRLNLFGLFRAIFFAECKFTDVDFMVAAALENDLLTYIEKQVQAGIKIVGDAIAKGTDKARAGVDTARKKVLSLRADIRNLQSKLDAAQKNYFSKLNAAQDKINSAARAVESADRDLGESLKKILDARAKMVAGRKKFDEALGTVAKISSEVNHAIKRLKSVARSMKWYEFWKVGELAYWSARVAVVKAAQEVARGVLEGIKATIKPLSSLLTATYGVAYAGGKAALATAYGTLEAALVAANPLTIDEFGEILGYSIALNSTKMSYYVAQGALISTSCVLLATREVVKGLEFVSQEMITMALEGLFSIKGGGFKCMMSDLKKGRLDLYLIAKVFGVKKNLKLVLDMARPDRTLASLGSLILDAVNPMSHGSGNMMAEIEAARKKFSGTLGALDTQHTAAIQEKDSLAQKQAERDAALQKMEAEHQQRLADMDKKYPFTQDDINNMGDMTFLGSEESYCIVDEKNPVSFKIKNLKNSFRWIDGWKLPSADSGCITFSVIGDENIQIGFHHQIKDQTSNKDFDVILGANNNTQHQIRTPDNKVVIASGDPAGMIKPQTDGLSNFYWISYDKGYVAVGSGKKPGDALLMDWQFTDMPAGIQYFSFSCANNNLTINDIHTSQAPPIRFGSQYSSDDRYGGFSWPFKLLAPNSGTITFTAKAADHLAIGLTDNPAATYARCMITLGAESNSKSVMASTSPDGKTYTFLGASDDTSVLLPGDNVSNYYPYWVTFDNGLFAAGTGNDPTKNVLMEGAVEIASIGATTIPPEPKPGDKNQKSPPPPAAGASGPCTLSHFSFSSWSNPVEVRNLAVGPAIPFPAGKRYSANDKKYYCRWPATWKLPEPNRAAISWEGKAASDMCLALSEEPTPNDGSSTYLCAIGSQNNTKTIIYDRAKKALNDTIDSAGLIRSSGAYTPYWCILYEKALLLGTGPIPGENVTLETTLPAGHISRFTFTNNAGFADFRNITVSEMNTPPTLGSQYTAFAASAPLYHPAWHISDEAPLIVFEARAHRQMQICIGGETEESYTIDIGNSDGKTAQITDQTGAILETKQAAKPHISDAFNFYPYWVLYDKTTGKLSCGHGINDPSSPIIETTLKSKPNLTKFGFANAGATPTYYKKIGAYSPSSTELKKKYADIFLKQTYTAVGQTPTATYDWNDVWKMASPEMSVVSFRTRTAGSARIALGNKADGAVYEVSISGSLLAIYKNKALVASSVDKRGLLPDDRNLYGYWISYYKGDIVVGVGQDDSADALLEWIDPTPTKNITHFSCGNQGGICAYEEIMASPAKKAAPYQVYSACKERGLFHWLSQWSLAATDRGYFTFLAKSNDAAVVGLGGNGQAYYTISIGTAQISITREARALASCSTQTGLNDNSFEAFWILFDRGYVGVGKGIQPSNDSLLVEYQDMPIAQPIQQFSLSSAGGQATYKSINSQLISSSRLAKNTSYQANAQKKVYTFSKRWTFVKQSEGTIIFNAQGDGPYYIGLDNRLSSLPNPVLEVVIGAEKNSCSQIQSNGTVVATTTDPHARINAQKSTFWITFNTNRISVGYGGTPGKGAFLDYENQPLDLSYFSFSSDTSAVKYTAIQSQKAGPQEKLNDFVIPANGGNYKYNAGWKFTSTHAGGLAFEGVGKNDISVGLSNSTSGRPLYEVVIGTEQNKSTVIKANGIVVAATDNPAALIRNEYVPTPYWVLYANGGIYFGTGKNIGENLLLCWQDPRDEQEIGYYGFGSLSSTVTIKKPTATSSVTRPRNTAYSASKGNGSFNWNSDWTVKPGTTVFFDATALNGEIYVGFNKLMSGIATYAVAIGGWKNTKSGILKSGAVVEKFDVTIAPDQKQWWVTYQPDSISVGVNDPTSAPLFTWKNSSPDNDIRYFSLSSGSSSVLYQNIRTQAAASVKMTSATDKSTQKAAAEEDPATIKPTTDPANPLFMPADIATLMKQPDDGGSAPATAPTQAAPDLKPEKPMTTDESMALLNTLKDDSFQTVDGTQVAAADDSKTTVPDTDTGTVSQPVVAQKSTNVDSAGVENKKMAVNTEKSAIAAPAA